MALFPKCTFQVLVTDGLVVPGERLEGQLVLDAPEPIPRAEHVQLDFRSMAWAGYGSGKNRSVQRGVMFHAPLIIDLPKGEPLAAGRHSYPFAIDVPPWLPPAYRGSDCAIEHVIETRLDVDWAIDPVAKLAPQIGMRPREDRRVALSSRSPTGFHDEIVVEVTLASSVVAVDEPIVGQVALRSGHAARFDAIELKVVSEATITMSRGDRRRDSFTSIRIPAEALRGGNAVPFSFPPNAQLLPSFRSAFIEHHNLLDVSVAIPWHTDPHFELPLEILPRGSTIHGETTTAIVGSERLRRIAAGMASQSGLREGRSPTLVSGSEGPVDLFIVDAPRAGRLGIDVELTFPDVGLGIVFRPLGLLEGFRTSPLLPPPLGDRYFLRCSAAAGRPPVDELAAAKFIGVVLSQLDVASEVRFSDHHLTVHVPLADDNLQGMVDIALASRGRAKAIADAIRELPFPRALAAARPAWEATAAEQSAFLVPSGPALHWLSFGARVIGGEERRMRATIRTAWEKDVPTATVEIDLRGAPLPRAKWGELEADGTSEALRLVRSVFPVMHATADGNGATLERAAWPADPRSLLGSLETFFWWVLDARGERRADLPYR